MKKLSKKFQVFLVIVIVLVGLFLRTYRLNLNSPALYSDEAVSYSYLTNLYCPTATIADFFCRILLRLTRFTWFLGLTPLGVRLPSALYGTAILLIIYFFTKQINFEKKEKQTIPLIALILAAFSPWGIHLSRIGHAVVVLSLISVGVHWLIYLKSKSIKTYLFSLVPLALSAYFYSSMIFIAPLVLLLVLIKIWQLSPPAKIKKAILVLGLIFIIFLGPIFVKKTDRGFDLATWRDVNVTANENVDRGLARLSGPTVFSFNQNPEFVSRFFYNRPVAVVNYFIRTYLSFYSPDFLFLEGDPILRHSTGRFGVFYPFLLPFMIYGAFQFFIKGEKKAKEMFLFWLIVTPVPAALTKDGAGYLLRVVNILPLLTYLSALGLVESLKFFKNKLKIIMVVLLSLFFIFSSFSFLFHYFHVYPAKSARSFEYGFKELTDWQKEENFKPLLVVWDGFYPRLFFGFWQPEYFKNFDKFIVKKSFVNQSTFCQGADNLYFSLPQTEEDLQIFLKANKILLLALPAGLKEKFNNYRLFNQNPIKIIYYPDQTPAFYLYENLY